MEYPIPPDWDGESWKRWAICWPDSPMWLGYLRGFVTYFTRGRAWDGKTGIIKDAQVIGWQITNNNIPLEEVAMSCSEANNVAKSILFLSAAVAGLQVNFDDITDLDEFFTGVHNFTELGLANRIAPSGEGTDPTSISNRMDQVRAAIEALSINVNIEEGTVELPGGEELANIVTELEELGTIWETRSVAETVAQNTNFEDLIAALVALELQCQTIVETTNLNQTINCGGTSGTGGAGTYPADPSGQTTTPEDEAGDPPPGFESWSEFRQYQCDMAHLILDQMIADIAAGGLLAAGAASVAALGPILVAVLLTPIGWIEIIAIAALFITLLAAGVSIASLTTLLEEHRNDFICALLDGTDVLSSISNFGNLCDSKVADDSTLGELPTFLQSQISGLIKGLASVDSINRLYEKALLPPPGGNDCSECGDEETEGYTIQLGEEVSDHPANPILIEYEIAGYGCEGNYHAQVTFSAPVTIDTVNFYNGTGTCSSAYSLLYYYDTPDTEQPPFLMTNTKPQDSAPVEGVRVILSTNVWDGTVPQIEISYTPA